MRRNNQQPTEPMPLPIMTATVVMNQTFGFSVEVHRGRFHPKDPEMGLPTDDEGRSLEDVIGYKFVIKTYREVEIVPHKEIEVYDYEDEIWNYTEDKAEELVINIVSQALAIVVTSSTKQTRKELLKQMG